MLRRCQKSESASFTITNSMCEFVWCFLIHVTPKRSGMRRILQGFTQLTATKDERSVPLLPIHRASVFIYVTFYLRHGILFLYINYFDEHMLSITVDALQPGYAYKMARKYKEKLKSDGRAPCVDECHFVYLS